MHLHGIVSDMTVVQPFRDTERLKIFLDRGQHCQLHGVRIDHEQNEARSANFAYSSVEDANSTGAEIKGYRICTEVP